KRTAEDLRKAIQALERATQIDSYYALAFVGLADCYALLGSSDIGALPPREAMQQTREALLKAIALDSTIAEAYASLGFINYTFDFDFLSAERNFLHAIELNRNYATAHHWYGLLLAMTGKAQKGIDEENIAIRLTSGAPIIQSDLGTIYYYTRQ